MNVLILAAGMGNRLMPLTKEIPKCMVAYKNKPLIDYLLEVLRVDLIKKIALVGGYKFEVLKEYTNHKIDLFYENQKYASTNMVYTLFCAKDFLWQCIYEQQDLLISYADIVFSSNVLKKLIQYHGDIGLAINTKWRELWSQRFKNPLDDAETLKIDCNSVIEIGKKAKNYDAIQGQYMGLIKVSYHFLEEMIKFYEMMDQEIFYDNKSFNQMYMTSFLQEMINHHYRIEPIFVHGEWFEIDSIKDLSLEYA